MRWIFNKGFLSKLVVESLNYHQYLVVSVQMYEFFLRQVTCQETIV